MAARSCSMMRFRDCGIQLCLDSSIMVITRTAGFSEPGLNARLVRRCREVSTRCSGFLFLKYKGTNCETGEDVPACRSLQEKQT